jgi:tetratricopeptide (TPR) repeat protein
LWFTLGRALGMADRYAEAEDAFRRAVQLQPDLPDARVNLALSLEYQRRLAEALEVLQQARARQPGDAVIAELLLRVLLGVLEEEAGGPPEPAPPLPPLAAEPLVSVIIPTRGRAQLLRDAVASALGQDYDRVEILVVNDGGEDVAPVLATTLAGRAHRAGLYALPAPRGAAAARNRALREAQGEVIAFLDDDDLYLPRHVETLVAALGGTGHAFAYTRADAVVERLEGEDRVELRRGVPRRHRVNHAMLQVRNLVPTATWGVRRECFERLGAFDETLACAEDWDMLLRISRRFPLRPVEAQTAEIRVRPGSRDSVTERVPLGPTSELLYRRYPSGGHPLIDLGREVYLGSLA